MRVTFLHLNSWIVSVITNCMKLVKYIFHQLFGDDSMWPRWIQFRLLVESSVYRIKSGREVTAYVEPPVAYEDCLGKLSSVWTQETGLTSVNITVVPTWNKCNIWFDHLSYCKISWVWKYILPWHRVSMSAKNPGYGWSSQ